MEASISKTRLLLENKEKKKKTHLLLKINSNPQGFLESTMKKGFGIHQRNNKQISEFLLISIILKNVYILGGLFKDSIKLDR